MIQAVALKYSATTGQPMPTLEDVLAAAAASPPPSAESLVVGEGGTAASVVDVALTMGSLCSLPGTKAE